MRASPALACLLALSACGGRGGPARPADGGAGSDGAGVAPDAAADAAPATKTSPDANVEVPAADVERRDAIPMLGDATLIGACGVPGAKCPTYVGTTTWMLASSYTVAGSMGPDGAIYIAGGIDNTFDFDPTDKVDVEGTDGQSSAYLMKLGPTGAYVSTLTIGGDTFRTPQMGAPAVTGSASFLTGYFEGTIDLDPGPGVYTVESEPTRGGSFVSKLDAAGKFVWGRVLASNDSGLVYWGGPLATPDGGVILTGTYASPADLDPGPAVVSPPGQSGAFVTRLDASGNLLWLRTLSCNSFGSPGMSAALDAGGVLWLSGTASDDCAFDPGSSAPGSSAPGSSAPGSSAVSVPNGFYVASMTLDGEIRTFGSVLGGAIEGPPVVARDGSIYLAGNVGPSGPGAQGPVDVDPSAGVSNRNVPDAGIEFVMKLDHDGKLRWLQPIDFDVGSPFGAVALAPDDGLVLVGDVVSARVDMSILRLDPDGNEVWRLSAGGSSSLPLGLFVNATGFFVLGQQSGPGDFDPSTGVDYQNGQFVFLSRYTF